MFQLNPFGDDVGACSKPKWQGLDISAGAWLMQQGVSQAAVDLMSIGTDYTDMWNTSALAMLRDVARSMLGGQAVTATRRSTAPATTTGTTSSVAPSACRGDGTQAREPGEVRQGAVTRIVNQGARAGVTCLDGSRHLADFVVCALPFSVLRRVTILPAPPAQARRSRPASTVARPVILEPTAPFWGGTDLRTFDVHRWPRSNRCSRSPRLHDGIPFRHWDQRLRP